VDDGQVATVVGVSDPEKSAGVAVFEVGIWRQHEADAQFGGHPVKHTRGETISDSGGGVL
jgi:hypothetical protein